MKPQTQQVLQRAEEAVTSLLEACRKQSQLYAQCPKVVAHISRTGKWHLNAIRALHRELKTAQDQETQA